MAPVTVFALDPYLTEFLKGNWQSLLLLFGILKGIAIMTPNTEDDKIVTMIQNLFTRAKDGSLMEKEVDDTKSD